MLLAGDKLDRFDKYFSTGTPMQQGSTYDLSIGKIYDSEGNLVDGHFTLEPGHMVQVVSKEIFSLPNDVTGHVTYKTGLTQSGVWALTVGIVDPGWNGPVATTLLNFSKVNKTIHCGDLFLRVTLFQHAPAEPSYIRKAPSSENYHKAIRRLAADNFPATFLNSKNIEVQAAQSVLKSLTKWAILLAAISAVFFSSIQIVGPFFSPYSFTATTVKEQLETQQVEIDYLKEMIQSLQK